MVYLHNVDPGCETGPAIRHFRERTTDSGLIAIEEIGRMHIQPIPDGDSESNSGIIIPPVFIGRLLEMIASGDPCSNPPDHVEIVTNSVAAIGLSEFVVKGLEAWNDLCRRMETSRARAFLSETEIRKPIENQLSNGGVIIPQPDDIDNTEFVRFRAGPGEMAALEDLRLSINSMPPADAGTLPGLYN